MSCFRGTTYYNVLFTRVWVCVSPVVCVVVPGAGRGVHVVSDQPVEVLVATDADVLHRTLGHVRAVGVEVAQDHHVLQHRGRRRSDRGTTAAHNSPMNVLIHRCRHLLVRQKVNSCQPFNQHFFALFHQTIPTGFFLISFGKIFLFKFS